MFDLYNAKYFWQCDKLLGRKLHTRVIRFFDHLFLTTWRYNRYVKRNTPVKNSGID